MIQYELRSGAKFPQDFWDDLLNVRFVDCKITVGQGERVVQAHRNVLSANSPYFKVSNNKTINLLARTHSRCF